MSLTNMDCIAGKPFPKILVNDVLKAWNLQTRNSVSHPIAFNCYYKQLPSFLCYCFHKLTNVLHKKSFLL